MPLPPALLKRLAKRGIVEQTTKTSNDSAATAAQPPPTEEIIAEDYDEVDEAQPFEYDYDAHAQSKKSQQNFWSERLKRRIIDGSSSGYRGCPNKYNTWHKCSLFCINTFGDGIKEPPKSYTKRKIRLLRRYPLPNDWKEVYDEGIGIHYYWNTSDDMVSWLPPSHPRANITKSAAVFRRELEALQPEMDDNEESNIPMPVEGAEMEYAGDSNHSGNSRDAPSFQSKPAPPKKPRARDLDKVLRAKNERRQKKESTQTALDPMDPAAYSDIPRGKWSAGLESENRKSGVDSSVSGTAFQMRPYPSPGAVLQANAQKSKEGRYDSDNSNDDERREED